MENFEFFTPTRVIFGKDTHLQAGALVKEYGFKKVLVHFGGAALRKADFWMQCAAVWRRRGLSI